MRLLHGTIAFLKSENDTKSYVFGPAAGIDWPGSRRSAFSAASPTRRQGHDPARHQRQGKRCRSAGPDAHSPGASRRTRADRHEIRLRCRPVRRVHGPPRRSTDLFLCDADLRGDWQKDHHHRKHRDQRPRRRGAGCLGARRRTAMRLLPRWPGDVGRGTAAAHSEPERFGHRRGHERQHLSPRHLYSRIRAAIKQVAATRGVQA